MTRAVASRFFFRLALLPRRSIRAKLALGFGLLIGINALFIYFHFPAQLERQAVRSVTENARSIAETTAYGLSPALYFLDQQEVEAALAGAMQNPDVLYLVVRDTTDAVVSAFSRDGAPPPAAALDETGISADRQVYQVTAPIEFNHRRIGNLALGVSLEDLHAVVAQSRAHTAGVSLVVFLLGTIGVFLVSTVLTRPLEQIVETAERITAGDRSQRVPIASADEVGSLARSFNTMVSRLETAYGELQLANRSLEDRVEVRTAELRREVDERIRAEAALRESEQRFRAMFESTAVAIALVDPHGAIIQVNPAHEQMLGRTPDELIGRPFDGLIHPEDLPAALATFHSLMRGEQDFASMELRCIHKNGAVIWGHATHSLVRDAAGRVVFGIAMMENITQRKELEEQYRQAQKLEAVGRLAGGVAHDFNNLLTTIIGTSDLILSGMPATDPVRTELEEILRAGERAASLTRQLLAFSRRQILQAKVIDLNHVVDETARMLRRLIGEHIELALELQPGLPSVKADPGQITQVIMNLAVNARDAMPAGGHLLIQTLSLEIDEVLARVYDTSQTGPHVMISVLDTGQGIDADLQEHIFEPFFTTKEVGKGTGLGLATVYGIVKQSGGGIALESEKGRGTVFRVVLPAVTAARVAEAPAATGVARGSETLLLVEDEASVRILVSRVLKKCGYTVLEACNPDEALHIHAAHPGTIQGVITDLIMPGMGGHELVQQLSLRQPGLKILYMSGYAEDDVARHTVLDAEVAFIQKPMSPAALAAKVRDVLDGTPTASA